MYSLHTVDERFAEADALVLIRERTAVTDALLAKLPRLKLISQTGKGTAHIDLDACKRRGVIVSDDVGVPPGVHDLLATRMERLSERAREVLTNARRSLYGILAEEDEEPREA